MSADQREFLQTAGCRTVCLQRQPIWSQNLQFLTSSGVDNKANLNKWQWIYAVICNIILGLNLGPILLLRNVHVLWLSVKSKRRTNLLLLRPLAHVLHFTRVAQF